MESDTFNPPRGADYDNVRTLNEAWLGATATAERAQRKRLAAAPFLLFSLRENDLRWWHEALLPQPDLLQSTASAEGPIRRIQSAALGFLWQLADRNPYAARLTSGASVAWCEKLTSYPLVTVIDRVAERADLARSRVNDAPLLDHPSQLAALQGLLTQTHPDVYRELPAAACRMSSPRLRVADKGDRSQD